MNSILFLLAVAASAPPPVFDPPVPASVARQRAMASAVKPCLPKEAGGLGVAYTVRAFKQGTIYTWWCDGKGYKIVADAASKPQQPKAWKALAVELSRLDVMYGYARDRGSRLEVEANAQLRVTRPRP